MTDHGNSEIIGFIGLGQMGLPMARNLARGGYRVLAYDAAGTQARLPEGGTAAGSVGGVAAGAETAFMSLPDGGVVEMVAHEIAAAPVRRLRTVIDTSTIGDQAAARAAEKLAPLGIAYVDAPVSGGVHGAVAASLAIMVACPKDRFEALAPTLKMVAKNVFHVGDRAGQGQAMKMLNNFLSATAMAATSEAVSFGLDRGLDMKTMLEVLNVSSGRNSATDDKFPRQVLPGTFAAGFATRLMTKDVKLYREGVRAADTPREVGELIAEIWSRCEQAMPGSDFTEIFKFVREAKR
jgi:3-hydroxyisobutyrate dehydrogenase-like beta-hydroxyacid dehydrogenase